MTTREEMHLHTQPVSTDTSYSPVYSNPNNRLLIDLVGSTLSDPYLAYSAALFALAGPLHG